MPLDAVFLDAGGVLVNPNWARVSEALAHRGVVVAPARLAAAAGSGRYGMVLWVAQGDHAKAAKALGA